MHAHERADLLLTPGFDLESIGDVSGHPRVFDSLGTDPQFTVSTDAGLGNIAPGWHRLQGLLKPIDGWIVCPRFYVDYGDGIHEAECLHVRTPGSNGLIDTIVRVKAPIRALRFDPTERTARFQVGSLSLRRVSTARALIEMLRALGRDLTWRVAVAAAARLVSAGLRGTWSQAAEGLLDDYIGATALPDMSYELWHRLYDPLRSDMDAKAEAGRASIDSPPTIALALRLSNGSPRQLVRSMESILVQTWTSWRLLLVIGIDTSPENIRLAEAAAARDRRMVLVRTQEEDPDEVAARWTQSAGSTHIGFMEPHSMLAPHAICEMVHAIAEHPDVAVIYSDSDAIGSDGSRHDPQFKPAWDRTMLLAQDYVGHFAVIRASLLRSHAHLAWRTPDWHHGLMLRCVQGLEADSIAHIPLILYHRGDEDLALSRTMHASETTIEAIQGNAPGAVTVNPLPEGRSRVTPACPEPPPLVSIIIPTRDRLPLLETCIASTLGRTDYPAFEIVVVDNGSREAQTLAYLEAIGSMDARCRVVRDPQPFNFSRLVNAGARAASGSLLCLLNNDIEVCDGSWLSELVAHAAQDDVGAVGAMLYYPDDTIQHGGVILGIGGVAGHIHHRSPRGSTGYMGRAAVSHELSAVTGACLLVKASAFMEVGGFDEELAVAFNDIDFCLKLLDAGYRNIWTPHAELYHHESASRGREDTPERIARFASEVERMKSRWQHRLLDDPAYNGNLSLDWSHFQLAFPPASRQRPQRSVADPGRVRSARFRRSWPVPPGQWRHAGQVKAARFVISEIDRRRGVGGGEPTVRIVNRAMGVRPCDRRDLS